MYAQGVRLINTVFELLNCGEIVCLESLVETSRHDPNIWPLLLTLSGKPRPQHLFGCVWPESVHHRAWPEGSVLTLWSPGWGQCGVRSAHWSFPWFCLCLLWENGGFQRGRWSYCYSCHSCGHCPEGIISCLLLLVLLTVIILMFTIYSYVLWAHVDVM